MAIASTQNKLCCRIDALHPTPHVYLFAMSAALDLDKCFALVSFSACGQQKVQVRMREAKTPQHKVAGLEWYTQADLNRQPSESESDALSSCAMGA